MIYCVSRKGVTGKGVTGKQTSFDDNFSKYINEVRENTELPIGVGFGVKSYRDVKAISDVADIAISCTEPIRILEKYGLQKSIEYFQSLQDEEK